MRSPCSQGYRERVYLLVGTPEPLGPLPWTAAISARFDRPKPVIRCRRTVTPVVRAQLIEVSNAFCRYDGVDLPFTDSNHISRAAGLAIVAPAVRAQLRDR